MKRVLLAGVSLSVTACAMSSTTPPSTAQNTRSSVAASSYLLSLAPTEQCTLWREVQGRRYCLDAPNPPGQAALPGLPAADGANQAVTNGEPVEKPPVAAPRMNVTVQPLGQASKADVPMPPATKAAQAQDLFVEMHRMGMIKAAAPSAQTAAMPNLPAAMPVAAAQPAVAEKTEANIDPKTAPVVPSNDLASLSRVAPGVFATDSARPVRVRQAFAPTTLETPIATATAVAAPADAGTASWQPVSYTVASGPRAVQLADADQPAQRSVVAETAGRAPVAAVERSSLPSVQTQRVVPLTIAKKATDTEPAVVVPAVPTAGNTQMAGTLPPLPALPPLPGETAAAAPSAPPAPPPVPAVKSATSSKPLAAPLPPPPAPPPLPDLARSDVPAKPAPAVEVPVRTARPVTPEAKVTRAALNRAAPAEATPAPATKPHSAKAASAHAQPAAAHAGTAKPASGRYLVLHSFREAGRANQYARQYSHLDAKVASVSLHGQTWYRVVVRDGAAQRNRLASDGVRGYWPVTL